jgi:Ca2+-binding EF-hand superfamily protein
LTKQHNKFQTITPTKSKPLGFVRPFDPADFRELFNSKDDKQVRSLVDKIFTSVDKDGSGEWEFDEVREMFKNLAFAFTALAGTRPTEDNIMNNAKKAFTEMDDDGDGVISKPEFLSYVMNKRSQTKSN